MAEKSFEKLISIIDTMSVIELSEAVKAMEAHYGVSAAPVAAVGVAVGAADAGAAATEKSQYKVELVDGGAEKIKVIKALRQVVPTLGLGEAKAAVEGGSFVVAEAASKDDAQKMKEVLEAAGAKVKLS